jgi:hypothetical protein
MNIYFTRGTDMIIDCFTFFNGLDVLEIRLNCLAPYVDRFVLCESPYNMLGVEKRLYFDENKSRFKDFNITHLIVENHLDHMEQDWEPYYYQMNYMMRAFKDADDDDIILLSDFDEIPNLTHYNGEEGVFRQKMYYYYLNVYTRVSNWKGTIATKKKHVRSFSRIRKRRGTYPSIADGWHFSYISSVEDIIIKIESFCHHELNTEEIKSMVAENKKNLRDPFNRSSRKFIVSMPTGPKWLLENRDHYEHLFYK